MGATYRGPIVGPPWWPAHEYQRALTHSGIAATDPRFRRHIARKNPLIFALIYLARNHLVAPDGRVHLSDLHCHIARSAKQWIRKDIGIAEIREAWIAPRGSAKSTWLCFVLPLWAAAFEHRRFIAIFGATRKKLVTEHYKSLRDELLHNELLRHDFPGLVNPKPGAGSRLADTYRAANGVSIVARGIDESNLGLNIGGARPDLIIFDDPEPDEGNFSEHKKETRLKTIRQGILGMNPRAVIQWAGTVTAYNCLAHDLVRSATGEYTADWIKETGFKTHYYPAILTDEDGTQRSLWPVAWDLNWLLSQRGIYDFELNFMNRPLSATGTLWEQKHFRYGVPQNWVITRRVMFIDPAVTSTSKSDYTGLCVAGYADNAKKVAINMANAVRVTPEGLRENVMMALARYPDIAEVIIEDNQGKDFVSRALYPLPPGVRLRTITSKRSKQYKFKEAFVHYQRGRVVHERQFPVVEDQMMAIPNGSHDDGADVVAMAVNELLGHLPRLAVS